MGESLPLPCESGLKSAENMRGWERVSHSRMFFIFKVAIIGNQ